MRFTGFGTHEHSPIKLLIDCACLCSSIAKSHLFMFWMCDSWRVDLSSCAQFSGMVHRSQPATLDVANARAYRDLLSLPGASHPEHCFVLALHVPEQASTLVHGEQFRQMKCLTPEAIVWLLTCSCASSSSCPVSPLRACHPDSALPFVQLERPWPLMTCWPVIDHSNLTLREPCCSRPSMLRKRRAGTSIPD